MMAVDAVAGERLRHQFAVAGRAGNERHLPGTRKRKPVDRLSSTTTGSPASTSACTMWLPI